VACVLMNRWVTSEAPVQPVAAAQTGGVES
jgi:hypothetical protein